MLDKWNVVHYIIFFINIINSSMIVINMAILVICERKDDIICVVGRNFLLSLESIPCHKAVPETCRESMLNCH